MSLYFFSDVVPLYVIMFLFLGFSFYRELVWDIDSSIGGEQVSQIKWGGLNVRKTFQVRFLFSVYTSFHVVNFSCLTST